jgi:hypothetical protein
MEMAARTKGVGCAFEDKGETELEIPAQIGLGRATCSKLSIRVQVMHLAAGGSPAGHRESGAAAIEVAQPPVWSNSCPEGLASRSVSSGLIHFILVVALVVMLLRITQGRRIA